MPSTITDTSFASDGVSCAAWHVTSELRTDDEARPCVVMAHGFGSTKDSGLEPFARAFAAAGIDALVFDYRGFGTSEGEPRQRIDLRGQVADYHAAIAHARSLPAVDPDRIVAWGVSMSGGHVFAVGADDPGLAAVISLTPAVDGRAATKMIIERDGLTALLRAVPAAIRDQVAAWRDTEPVMLPLAGKPGDLAALTAPGAYEEYTAVAGPTWRNEFTARTMLRAGSYRPGRRAGDITAPVLVQIGDLDRTAPPLAAQEAARRVPVGEVRHYPCDHFDVYEGRDWHTAVVAHQIDFLTRRVFNAAATP